MADAGLVLATRQARMMYKTYEATNDLPADTVDWGEDWGDDYIDIGYTNGGIGTSMNVDRAEIRVDQLFYPVMRPITGGSIRFDTNLAEFSPENLLLASGIGTMADGVAPGAGTRGHEELTIPANFEEQEFTIAWEAVKRDGEAFRAIIPRSISVSSPNPRVGQADANAQIAFEVEALPPDDAEDHDLAVFRSISPALPAE